MILDFFFHMGYLDLLVFRWVSNLYVFIYWKRVVPKVSIFCAGHIFRACYSQRLWVPWAELSLVVTSSNTNGVLYSTHVTYLFTIFSVFMNSLSCVVVLQLILVFRQLYLLKDIIFISVLNFQMELFRMKKHCDMNSFPGAKGASNGEVCIITRDYYMRGS